MTAGRDLARAGLLVTGAYLLSRLLGWVRLAVIGSTFGIQGALDPFLAAFRIPDLIFQLVAAGALASALIPTIAALAARGEEARAWRVVSTVTNLMLIGLAVLAGSLLVLAPWVMPAVTPGFDAAQLAETVDLTRLMLLSPIFLALGSVATSVLQARGRFAASVAAPIVYNLAIIGGAIGLAPTMGVTGLAVGVVAGSACHLAVQLGSLRSVGYRWSPRIDLRDEEARRAIVLLVPRAIGLGGAQLQLVAATTLASGLGAGAISVFTVAFLVFQIPIGVIGVPLGVVALPALSQHMAAGAVDEFASLVTRALRLMAFAMAPLAAFGIIAARPVVTLLFEYGKVDAQGVAATASTLAIFLVALPSESAIVLLARAFYAGRDTRTPVAAALLAVVVSVAISVAVAPAMGVQGLALGIVVASWVEAVALMILLERRAPTLRMAALVRGLGTIVVAAAASSAVLWVVLAAVDGAAGPAPGKIVVAAELLVAGVAGGLAYLGLATVLRIPEVPAITRLIRSAVRRERTA